MRLLILDENYPHEENLLGDVFVHVRAKEYIKYHEVQVYSFFHQRKSLVYEGINIVFFNDEESLAKAIEAFNPDRILIHFYQYWMLQKIILKNNTKVLIWVHGYEALGWYRRLFNYNLFSPVFFRFIFNNIRQQYQFRKLISFANHSNRIHFIFVSKWMKKITELDTLKRIKNFSIIPNPIDTKLFVYSEKEPSKRLNVLLLRSFSSRKYANDISVEAILEFSKSSYFREFNFTIMGKGILFKKLVLPLRNFSNVFINESILPQKEIPLEHKKNGIFLCPTRQDAQGVSMCEAMSSGLVPITTDNTAIPEFVNNNETGFLTNSSSEISEALTLLYKRPEIFKTMSENAASSIKTKCDINIIVSKELKLIEL